MVKHQTAYLFFSCLSVTMLALAFYFLLREEMVYAWMSSVCAVCSTKGRIAVGGRVRRTLAFYLHLACSIPGFLLLSYLAFVAVTPKLFLVTLVLYALTFVTGIPLWLEGVRRVYRA